MSTKLGIGVAFVVGLSLGVAGVTPRSLQEANAGAGSTGPAVENGDTNGDGQRDVSDAVYLLRWLFVDGPPPASLEPPRERFTDHGDGTITDTLTGLLWTRATVDLDLDGEIDVGDLVPVESVYEVVAGLELAGRRGWRLPNQTELVSILDFGATPAMVSSAFDVEDSWYWVGSSNSGDPCHGAPMVMHLPWGILRLHGDGSDGSAALVLAVRAP